MKAFKKLTRIDDGKLVAAIISVMIIFLLAMFTELQTLSFTLKMFILVGVVYVSVWIMRFLAK